MITIHMTRTTITFDGRAVAIDRHRTNGHLPAGRKVIPIEQISGIRWRDARTLAVGYLAFTIPGAIERTGQLKAKDLMRDENTLTFMKAKQPEYEALRDAIQAAIAGRGAAHPPAPTPSPLVDELARLADLHQQGALTDDEFQQAKARLLGGQ